MADDGASDTIERSILSCLLTERDTGAINHAMSHIPCAVAFADRDHQMVYLGGVRAMKRRQTTEAVVVADVLSRWTFEDAVCELSTLDKLHAEYITGNSLSWRKFRELLRLTERGDEVDDVPFADTALAAIGGYPALADLTSDGYLPSSIHGAVGMLIDRYRQRYMARMFRWAHALVGRPDGIDDMDGISDRVEQALHRLVPQDRREADVPQAILDGLHGEAMYEPCSSGIAELDHCVDLHTGHFCVLGGWPGAGKTSLAAQWAAHTADSLGLPGAAIFISLEKPTTELARQMAAQRCGIDSRRVYRSDLSDEERARLSEVAHQWRDNGQPVTLLGQEVGSHIDSVEVVIRRHQKSHPHCRMAVIDNAQLLSAGGKGIFENISEVTRRLRLLRNETGMCILLVSHVTPTDKDKKDPHARPTLAQLRGGADMRMHPTAIVLMSADDPSDMAPTITVELAKSNLGPEGECLVTFDKSHGQRFTRYVPPAPAPHPRKDQEPSPEEDLFA